MTTSENECANKAPLYELLASEAAIVCPDVDLDSNMRLCLHALEVSRDDTLAPDRREFARCIGLDLAQWLVRLADSARTRQGM